MQNAGRYVVGLHSMTAWQYWSLSIIRKKSHVDAMISHTSKSEAVIHK